ncbi:MAG: ArsA family ATPase [Gemmatimonadota bacterium]
MLLTHLGSQRILFIGGKGGVGKTTTAGALGLALARRGEKVLLVSTDPAHSLGDLFGMSVGDSETQVIPGLTALEIDPEGEVERYLGQVRESMRTLVGPDRFPDVERQLHLTRHSPGAVEAALLDRVAEIMTWAGQRYDRILFDTAPTGHTLRLLTLPEIMSAWVDGLLRGRERSRELGAALQRLAGGPREKAGSGDELSIIDGVADAPENPRDRQIHETLLTRRRSFTRARRLILDPETTAFILVLIPEKLPILESRKTLAFLREHKMAVLGIVVNRVLPEEAEGAFLRARREQEARYLEEIDSSFAGLPRFRVPYLPQDVEGVAGLETVVRELGG